MTKLWQTCSGSLILSAVYEHGGYSYRDQARQMDVDKSDASRKKDDAKRRLELLNTRYREVCTLWLWLFRFLTKHDRQTMEKNKELERKKRELDARVNRLKEQLRDISARDASRARQIACKIM